MRIRPKLFIFLKKTSTFSVNDIYEQLNLPHYFDGQSCLFAKSPNASFVKFIGVFYTPNMWVHLMSKHFLGLQRLYAMHCDFLFEFLYKSYVSIIVPYCMYLPTKRFLSSLIININAMNQVSNRVHTVTFVHIYTNTKYDLLWAVNIIINNLQIFIGFKWSIVIIQAAHTHTHRHTMNLLTAVQRR